jgi:hypothetical protein
VLLTCHHNMVQAFPPDRTDQALSIPVLPWRACRCGMIANPKRANSANEYAAITSIAITDQEGTASSHKPPSVGWRSIPPSDAP